MGEQFVFRASNRLKGETARALLARALVGSGKLTEMALQRAEEAAEQSGQKLEFVLTHLGLVSEQDLADLFCEVFGLRPALKEEYPHRPVLEGTLSATFLKDVRVIPLEEADSTILLALVNPLDDYALAAVQFATGKVPICRVAYPKEFDAAFELLYGNTVDNTAHFASSGQSNDDVERLADRSSDAPVIKFVNGLISRAVESRASDIHIEPTEDGFRVRYRIDGILREVERGQKWFASAIISRIKIMARLNVAERRLAQDGRITLAVRGRQIDIRVSTGPTMHGESAVLRILDRQNIALDFESLGFDANLTQRFRKLIENPHGIALVTGPTGSGKTTSLYAALLSLNSCESKILSIEDPIEYQLRGVNQLQVKPQIGLTFANALRSFLRQDPDVIMVGEIRDLETAEIAVQAALTGHIILSSLHTNDAASAITRLLDMGVEKYLLTSTVNGIVGQRLVRVLCEACREPYKPAAELVDALQICPAQSSSDLTLFRAKGCGVCGGTGYFGRTSIAEILTMSDAIRNLVLSQPEAAHVEKAAVSEGMRTMFQHGLQKAACGITSVEEVIRVTRMA